MRQAFRGQECPRHTLQSHAMGLILASASPRRRELLQAAGIPFTAQATDIPEIPEDGEEPQAFAERLAREKALAIAHEHPDSAVLGADTIVVVDGIILGKPVDAADAARMLRLLSGRSHEVITAVCLIVPSVEAGPNATTRAGTKAAGLAPRRAGEGTRPYVGGVGDTDPGSGGDRGMEIRSERTGVTFSRLSEDEIAFYIATGEPLDKAGAYGIQGIAARWIPRIEGDYSNVVGLPVALVFRLLKDHGLL